MRVLQEHSAMHVIAPSPLVGEGSSAGRRKLGRVRGTLATIPLPRQPLTRLRFAQPPSPTRGEGAPEFGATFVRWAKAHRAVPTIVSRPLSLAVGTLRFAHPTAPVKL